jgi:integrase
VGIDRRFGCRWSSPARPHGLSSLTSSCAPNATRLYGPSTPPQALRTFAGRVGVEAHPHLLRHALASGMATAKEPASIIAGQLRHADGGALAGRTYIHQIPQTPSRMARLIEDLYGPAARQARRDRG